MFPFTPHIETLGIFVRDEVGDGRPPESVVAWPDETSKSS